MPAFETSGPITATIEVPVGDVRIAAAEPAATVVDVRPTDADNEADVKAAQLTRVEFGDERLLVRAPRTGSWFGRNAGSVDVSIELPAGSHVQGTGGSADFRAEGDLGDCRIKTGLGRIWLDRTGKLTLRSGVGDISVDRAAGHAEVTTGSGELRLGTLDSSAAIKNSNGDTWVGSAGGDLRIKVANGSIAVDEAHATVAAKSANGDVRIGAVVRGTVVLETHTGDLEVGIREGTAAWLDVRATAGKVHNGLEPSEAPAGGEKVEIRARTTAGDVIVRRP